MTTGVIKTKGTRLFFAFTPSEVLMVACPTAITGLGGPGGQIETTCLNSVEREYEVGMPNPGQINVPINFIPRSAAHQALLALKESQEKISWMIVLSDQGSDPTHADANNRIVSPGATTAEFLASVDDFNFTIAANQIVQGALILQRSGAVAWTLPTADLP